MSCERLFQDELRRRGLRVTSQREAILAALHECDDAVTADELHRRSLQRNPGLEFSTVYRTLRLLESIGLVTMVDSDSRQQRFLHVGAGKPHFHLRCRGCGEILGVDLDRLETLSRSITEEFGFEVDGASVTLAGICRECRR